MTAKTKVCFLGPTQVGKTTFIKALENPENPLKGRLRLPISDLKTAWYVRLALSATTSVRELEGVLEFPGRADMPISFIDLPGEEYTRCYLEKDPEDVILQKIRPFINECPCIFFFFSKDDFATEDAARACLNVVDDYVDSTGRKPHVTLVLTKCDLIPELGSHCTRRQVEDYFQHEVPERSRQQFQLLESRAETLHYAPLAAQPEGAPEARLPVDQFAALFHPFRNKLCVWPVARKLLTVLLGLAVLSVGGYAYWQYWEAEQAQQEAENRRKLTNPTSGPAQGPTDLGTLKADIETTGGKIGDEEIARQRIRWETLRTLKQMYAELKRRHEAAAAPNHNERDVEEYRDYCAEWKKAAEGTEFGSLPPEITSRVLDLPLLEAICAKPDFDHTKENLGYYLSEKMRLVDAYLLHNKACPPEERATLSRALEVARQLSERRRYKLTVTLAGGTDSNYRWGVVVRPDLNGVWEETPYPWTSKTTRFSQTQEFSWAAGEPIRVTIWADDAWMDESPVGSFLYPNYSLAIAELCKGADHDYWFSTVYDPWGAGDKSDFYTLYFKFRLQCENSDVALEDIQLVRQYIIFNQRWLLIRDEVREEARMPFPELPQQIRDVPEKFTPSGTP